MSGTSNRTRTCDKRAATGVGGRRVGLALATALGLLGFAPLALADIHVELPDAGESFATTQQTIGMGALDEIRGTLSDEFDVDIYFVVAPDLANFSISVAAQMQGAEANNDLTITIFRDDGRFAFQDLDSGPGLLPAIPLGELDGLPLGSPFLVAISAFNNRPGQLISPISSWIKDPLPPQSGPYQLTFTGATFSQIGTPPAVPSMGVPGALLLVVSLIGLGAFVGRTRSA